MTEILEFYPDTVSFVQKIKIPFASFITDIVFISTELTQKNLLENVIKVLNKEMKLTITIYISKVPLI